MDEQSPRWVRKGRAVLKRPALLCHSSSYTTQQHLLPDGISLVDVSRYGVQHRPGFGRCTGGLKIAPPQKFHILKSSRTGGPGQIDVTTVRVARPKTRRQVIRGIDDFKFVIKRNV